MSKSTQVHDIPVTISQEQIAAIGKRFGLQEDILLESAFRLTLAVWNAETENWVPDMPVKDLLASVGNQEAETPEVPEEFRPSFADSLSACLKSMKKAATFADLAFASEAQVAEVEGFNPPPVDFDTERTLLDLFKDHVDRYPDNPAVVSSSVLLTQAALDALTDRLAAYISGIVKPGGIVSVILGRNEYMVAAPLAVLKAGCAYQPLDPSYPSERLSFMVKDAGAALLIADPGLEQLVGG